MARVSIIPGLLAFAMLTMTAAGEESGNVVADEKERVKKALYDALEQAVDKEQQIPASGPAGNIDHVPFRSIMALQARLDCANFSCGCIDGVLGRRTRDAIAAWQGRPDAPVSDADIWTAVNALGQTNGAFLNHEVADADSEGLAPVPSTWTGKACMSTLGHETILERLAEKYHVTQSALRRLNPHAEWPDPAKGTSLTVPKSFPAPRYYAARLSISLERKLIRVYDVKGRLRASFPCSIAAKVEKRPVGELYVTSVADNPNYTFDPVLFQENAEARTISKRLMIPSGPNNPVGTVWIGLDRAGYGIHGTPHPEDVGKTESHGCFRLTNWNAEKLLRMITIGTPVQIGF